MTADPTPAADPRPSRKPQTIKGHALSSALRLRAVEWSSEVDVDAWIADIEAEARTAPAADPRLAQIAERVAEGKPIDASDVAIILALLSARTATTEADPFTDEHGFDHADDSYGQCFRCRIWSEGTGDDEVYLTEPWPCPTVRLARTVTTEAVALAAACVRHDLDQHGCTQAEAIAAALAATGGEE